MTERSFPAFRYHPDPIASGVIAPSEEECPVCGKVTGFEYTGPFYSVADVEAICPWCIASGAAAREFDGEFMDSCFCGVGVAPEYRDELLHRTPGYFCWQTEVWPVHCEEPCAFQGRVGWPEIAILHLEEELSPDIEAERQSMNLSLEQFQESLVGHGSHQGYLFQCVRCGKHRLHTDLD